VEQFCGQKQLSHLAFADVVNAFRSELANRARRSTQPLDSNLADRGGANPATLALTAELGRIGAHAVSSLPPRQREVMVLHTYEQLTDSEIAQVLAMNSQNVRTTLHLARQRLKRMLEPYLSDVHAARRNPNI
jgi:RNA polymerase sigma factor (sigma-70 family)